MSFRFGWGGVAPPMEGARLPRRPAHPFRLRERPSVLVLFVRVLGGATNEGTYMDPVHKLLEKDEHREAALRALGDAHHALDEAIAVYRTAFKAATSIGWPKADLTKAGFPDPTRLPKASLRSSDAEA